MDLSNPSKKTPDPILRGFRSGDGPRNGAGTGDTRADSIRRVSAERADTGRDAARPPVELMGGAVDVLPDDLPHVARFKRRVLKSSRATRPSDLEAIHRLAIALFV